MRFEISMTAETEICLPIQYNPTIQGMIYNHISPEFGTQLHDTGYLYEKRSFKLFTFSRINGLFRLDRESQEIIFSPPIRLTVSSPIERFIYELGYSMVTSDHLQLGDNLLTISGINIPLEPDFTSSELIRMLSPITVYSTLKTAEGKSKTYYYSPYEDEFSRLIESNLKKKYKILYSRDPNENQSFSIKPVKAGKGSEKIIKYKGTVIKGWMGIYLIQGDPELIKVGYEAGLGSKNSQGFGCFESIKRGDKHD